MEPHEHNLKNRMKALIQANKIHIPKPPKIDMTNFHINTLNKAQSQSVTVGQICDAIVVAKNDVNHQLQLHIIKVYPTNQSKPVLINFLKLKAIIRDYDLREHFSIFTYVYNYQHIKIGTLLTAVVKRTQKRKNETIYQLCPKNPMGRDSSTVLLGVKRDDIEITSQLMTIYEEKNTFPLDFLCQYTENFQNMGIGKQLTKQLKKEDANTLNPISNLSSVKRFCPDIQRVRHHQEKSWSDQYFHLGLDTLKRGEHKNAILLFDSALQFNQKNPNIYIAKGCALANMKNPSEGLKEIKEALKIDPNNQIAQGYLKDMKQQIDGKVTKFNSQQHKSMKQKSNSNEFVHKKY